MKLQPSLRFSKKSLQVYWALAVCSLSASALGITIDSSRLDVSGGWSESGRLVEGGSYYYYDSFAFSSSDGQPLNVSVQSNPYHSSSASFDLDPFGLAVSAYSSPWYGIIGQGTGLGIDAGVTTRFHVDGSKLNLTLTGFSEWNYSRWEQGLQMTLVDLTASSTLLNRSDLAEFSRQPINEQYSFDVDPSHEYAFTISGFIDAANAKDARLNAQVSLAEAVPDSGVTSLMLGGALFALITAKTLFEVNQ